MGLLDYIFGNKKKEQERLRLEEEARHKYVQQRINHIQKMAELAGENHSSKGDEVVYLAVFSASWCGPSKRFIKEINEAGVNNYAYIDVDKEEELSVKFGIRSVPTTLLIDSSDTVIKRWVGYDDEDPGQSKFVHFINNYMGKIMPYKNGSSVSAPSTETKIQSKGAPSHIEQEQIIEDHRTTFYELENIKYRAMGKELMLAPYDGFSLENYPDADVLPALANTEKIQRFLPNLGFKDKESTQKRLAGYIIKTESQMGVTYVIRYNNIPMGMVFVNTPLYNKKSINLAIWTIDFYISEMLEHQGIIYNAILRVLHEMKIAMNAKVVYALVDQDNHDCIKVIGNGLFEKVNFRGFKNSDGGLPPLIFKKDLSKI